MANNDHESRKKTVVDTDAEGSGRKRGSASRARNKTVMLSSDMASQVRARLMQAESGDSDIEDGGFTSPLSSAGTFSDEDSSAIEPVMEDEGLLEDVDLEEEVFEEESVELEAEADFREETIEEALEKSAIGSIEEAQERSEALRFITEHIELPTEFLGEEDEEDSFDVESMVDIEEELAEGGFSVSEEEPSVEEEKQVPPSRVRAEKPTVTMKSQAQMDSEAALVKQEVKEEIEEFKKVDKVEEVAEPFEVIANRKDDIEAQGIIISAQSEKTKLMAFLVSYDNNPNGEFIALRTGRWIVSSKKTEHGDYILIDDQSISPLHAIIKVNESGVVQVLDQLSDCGTAVLGAGKDKEEEIIGAMVEVSQGDRVRFGSRNFAICLVAQ